MSGHDAAKRFLLFCGCCNQNFIQKTALDTLDNIAEYVSIGFYKKFETCFVFFKKRKIT